MVQLVQAAGIERLRTVGAVHLPGIAGAQAVATKGRSGAPVIVAGRIRQPRALVYSRQICHDRAQGRRALKGLRY